MTRSTTIYTVAQFKNSQDSSIHVVEAFPTPSIFRFLSVAAKFRLVVARSGQWPRPTRDIGPTQFYTLGVTLIRGGAALPCLAEFSLWQPVLL